MLISYLMFLIIVYHKDGECYIHFMEEKQDAEKLSDLFKAIQLSCSKAKTGLKFFLLLYFLFALTKPSGSVH